MRWKPVIDAFAIMFSDRWPGAETTMIRTGFSFLRRCPQGAG
jgi:hypothetical protein